MFCFVHTDQWIADTGFIGDDDQEIGATRSRLLNCCTMMQPSVPPLVSYLNVRIE